MPRKRPPPPERDPRDLEIQQLRNDLWRVRDTVMDMVPAQLRDWLHVAHDVETRRDLVGWQRWAIDRLTLAAAAEPGLDEAETLGESRALCPLCGREPYQLRLRGFALPKGLRQHLAAPIGRQGCRVFAVARELCEASVRDIERGRPWPKWSRPRLKPWLEAAPLKQASPVRDRRSVAPQGGDVDRPADQDSVVAAPRRQVFDLEEARARRAQRRDVDDHGRAEPHE